VTLFGWPLFGWIFLLAGILIGLQLRSIARNTRRPPTPEELREKAAMRRWRKYGDASSSHTTWPQFDLIAEPVRVHESQPNAAIKSSQ
jgi:hypothetical protein